MEIYTKDNGKVIKKKAQEYTYIILQVKNMKENGKGEKEMVMAYIILRLVINMMECNKKI
jgi:hypothetical protein